MAELYSLHCITDFSELDAEGAEEIKDRKTGRIRIIPLYKCPKCRKVYSNIQSRTDSKKIDINGKMYINITVDKDKRRYLKHLNQRSWSEHDTDCYVFLKSKGTFECRKCGGHYRRSLVYLLPRKKRGYAQINVLVCNTCGMRYLDFHTYKTWKDYWTPLNYTELPDMEKKVREAALHQQEKKKELKKVGFEQLQINEREEKVMRKELEKFQREVSAKTVDVRIGRSKKAVQIDTKRVISKDNNTIEARDFVVRCSVFKCRFNNHSMQNVSGIIKLIDRNGNIQQEKIAAGYCVDCNTFFIMESVYQALKMKGIPVCRLSDEKTYQSSTTFVNGMQLAQESILMQYGYSVSLEENLTIRQRQKILALIIDNSILTKNEIIGYLDFFINQRKKQDRFEKAIDKWESDREFVAKYKTGDYKQYGVARISRKY